MKKPIGPDHGIYNT